MKWKQYRNVFGNVSILNENQIFSVSKNLTLGTILETWEGTKETVKPAWTNIPSCLEHSCQHYCKQDFLGDTNCQSNCRGIKQDTEDLTEKADTNKMFKLQSTQLSFELALTWLNWPWRAEDLKLHKWEMERNGFSVHSGPCKSTPTPFF